MSSASASTALNDG